MVKFDEIQVKKNLVIKKNTGRIVGYMNLSEVERELVELQNTVTQLAAAAEGTVRTSQLHPHPQPRHLL